MDKKAKGTRGERELVKAFNENGWVCIRVAGSGSSRYPSPDILAGNAMRRVAIECKVTADNKNTCWKKRSNSYGYLRIDLALKDGSA